MWLQNCQGQEGQGQTEEQFQIEGRLGDMTTKCSYDFNLDPFSIKDIYSDNW